MAAVVWVGYDDDRPLGPREEGSRTALPVWIDFARSALTGRPERTMPVPDGIVSARINKLTGCPADFGTNPADVMFESFRLGNVPECEKVDTVVDPFNMDNFDDIVPLTQEEDDEEEEEEESLF